MIKRRFMNSVIRTKNKLLVNKGKGVKGNFFFVHIPKTAGSSFRDTVEKNYKVFRDYGNDSNSTFGLIQKHIYEEKDFFVFKKSFLEEDEGWIAGHVSLAKYLDHIPVVNTVTFVRSPLEQVLSHYNHHVSQHNYEGDIEAFLDKPFTKNFQSKFLSYLPISLIGCVGVTERYDESLDLINSDLQTKFSAQAINVNKTKVYTDTCLEDRLHKYFIENNKNDIAMYEEALYLHELRLNFNSHKKVWTYATVKVTSNKVLVGCAYQRGSSEAIDIIVNINGNKHCEVAANKFYAAYPKANFPRDRYIGFNLPLPVELTSSDKIDVFVKSTGQKINFKPLNL